MLEEVECPVCGGGGGLLGAVDFNKSCNALNLPGADHPVRYWLCHDCRFCFAPEFSSWSLEDFEAQIYNDDYVQVDPDYLGQRPRENANALLKAFGSLDRRVRHLDYGGGDGLMSRLLCENHWQSQSYDPFVDKGMEFGALGQFDLITAYEVFEHVPDVWQLALELGMLLKEDGIVLFSTLVSDGKIYPGCSLDWWYVAPRNGHISIFSRESLALLAAAHGFNFNSYSNVHHIWWRNEIPPWAKHFFE